MIATVSDDLQTILLQYDSPLERDQMEVSFTKKIRNWRFRTKNKRWKGDVSFIKYSNTIPIGMWKELQTICDRFGFPLKVKGLSNVIDTSLEFERFDYFVSEIIKGTKFKKKFHQVDAAYKAVKYRFCMIDLATSGGKTFVEFCILFWLFYTKKITQLLIICPDADLVIQTYQEFLEYANGKYGMRVVMVHGGTDIKDISNERIIIGNFQTLSNRPPEFFKDVDCVFNDECHRGGNDSIKKIIENCKKAKYKIGMSGSIVEDNSADYFDLLSQFGPIVKKVKKKELMQQGDATPIEIKVFKLNYATKELRHELAMMRANINIDPETVYRMERQMVRNSEIRFQWLISLICKLTGNTIVFFSDKKGGYGKKIMEGLKRATQGREIYYVDGDVKTDMRDAIKARMEEGDNKILVASFETYGTGKSIKNIHNLVCAESRKGEVVINQVTGRGMRLHESKDKFMWIDIIDDFNVFDELYDFTCYGIKHWNQRRKYYEQEGFDWDMFEIVLDDKLIA